jgi:hypothetical protein
MVSAAPLEYSTAPLDVDDQPLKLEPDFVKPLLVIAWLVPAVKLWPLMLPLVAVLESKVRVKVPAVHFA